MPIIYAALITNANDHIFVRYQSIILHAGNVLNLICLSFSLSLQPRSCYKHFFFLNLIAPILCDYYQRLVLTLRAHHPTQCCLNDGFLLCLSTDCGQSVFRTRWFRYRHTAEHDRSSHASIHFQFLLLRNANDLLLTRRRIGRKILMRSRQFDNSSR